MPTDKHESTITMNLRSLSANLRTQSANSQTQHVNTGSATTTSTNHSHPFLLPHTSFKLAAFNVRTLRQEGQQAALASTMESFDISVCCLSETRLYDSTNVTKLVSPIPDSRKKFYLRCSGDPSSIASGTAGTSIALNEEAENSLIEWIPINSRLCAVRLDGSCRVNRNKTIKRCLFVVAAYAPTDCSSDIMKDQFYDELNNLILRAPSTDLVVLAGDFNARVGRLNSEELHLGGTHGLDSIRNDNGDRLLSLCADHRLFITSTNFRHHRRHRATWRPVLPSQNWTQIDHVAVSYRWRGSVKDCRSHWNTCLDSDHAMVCAKFSMSFCGQRPNRFKRIDVIKLKNSTTLDSYQNEISISLSTIPTTPTIEDHWSSLREVLYRVGLDICGTSSRNYTPWISDTSLQLLQTRRTIPSDVNYNQQRRNLTHQLTRSLRIDKESWWRRQADDMQTAWNTGDSRRLFCLIRSVSSRRAMVSENICEVDGTPITNLQRRVYRWAEHFQTQFNWPPATTTDFSIENVTEWRVSTEPPTDLEIREAARSFKDHKSAGEDDIPSELIKYGGDALFLHLRCLFSRLWTEEVLPLAWSQSIIVPIFKKGQRTDCSNHRGISLISTVSKLFTIILLRRLSQTRELTAREEQAGFRPGRGCVDQIFTLRLILEHRRAYARPTIIVFLDIRAAFDAVDREALWNCLLLNGVPSKFVRIMKALYTNTSARVRVYNTLSDNFSIKSGVRQGCPISPFLFNFVIDDVIAKALVNSQSGGVELLPGSRVSDLEYADDIVAMGDNTQAIQSFLDNLAVEISKYGMYFSPSKCKAMVQDWTLPPPVLTLVGEPLELVDCFTYLGSQISAKGDIAAEISSRISKARAAFCNLRHLWRRRDISLHLKGRVYTSTVRAVLLYGCEGWTLRRSDMKRLQAFDHRCLRSIARVWWQLRISNAEVRRRVLRSANNTDLEHFIVNHQLRWLGHVLRMHQNRLPKRALFALPGTGWVRKKGGQYLSWNRMMKNLTSSLASTGSVRLPGWGPRDKSNQWLETLSEMARDRHQWRTCCKFLDEN